MLVPAWSKGDGGTPSMLMPLCSNGLEPACQQHDAQSITKPFTRHWAVNYLFIFYPQSECTTFDQLVIVHAQEMMLALQLIYHVTTNNITTWCVSTLFHISISANILKMDPKYMRMDKKHLSCSPSPAPEFSGHFFAAISSANTNIHCNPSHLTLAGLYHSLAPLTAYRQMQVAIKLCAKLWLIRFLFKHHTWITIQHYSRLGLISLLPLSCIQQHLANLWASLGDLLTTILCEWKITILFGTLQI